MTGSVQGTSAEDESVPVLQRCIRIGWDSLSIQVGPVGRFVDYKVSVHVFKNLSMLFTYTDVLVNIP